MSRTAQGNRLGRSIVAELKSAPLSGEFGMKMLRAKFANADEILARLGVHSKGPRKGQPRGLVTWRKVSEGGWNYQTRRVERPGCTDWDIVNDAGKSIAAEIHHERMNAERAIEDAKRAEFVALPEWRQALELAFKARRRAHEELRGGDREEFHDAMRRARGRVENARIIRAHSTPGSLLDAESRA